MGFKEVFCHDCKTILARYNADYFSDLKVTELTRLHHNVHIRSGHSVTTRLTGDNDG
ncbi:MAG: hypothetical protein ACRD5J_12655 [Nitrososphaeraceae archaeon]